MARRKKRVRLLNPLNETVHRGDIVHARVERVEQVASNEYNVAFPGTSLNVMRLAKQGQNETVYRVFAPWGTLDVLYDDLLECLVDAESQVGMMLNKPSQVEPVQIGGRGAAKGPRGRRRKRPSGSGDRGPGAEQLVTYGLQMRPNADAAGSLSTASLFVLKPSGTSDGSGGVVPPARDSKSSKKGSRWQWGAIRWKRVLSLALVLLAVAAVQNARYLQDTALIVRDMRTDILDPLAGQLTQWTFAANLPFIKAIELPHEAFIDMRELEPSVVQDFTGLLPTPATSFPVEVPSVLSGAYLPLLTSPAIASDEGAQDYVNRVISENQVAINSALTNVTSAVVPTQDVMSIANVLMLDEGPPSQQDELPPLPDHLAGMEDATDFGSVKGQWGLPLKAQPKSKQKGLIFVQAPPLEAPTMANTASRDSGSASARVSLGASLPPEGPFGMRLPFSKQEVESPKVVDPVRVSLGASLPPRGPFGERLPFGEQDVESPKEAKSVRVSLGASLPPRGPFGKRLSFGEQEALLDDIDLQFPIQETRPELTVKETKARDVHVRQLISLMSPERAEHYRAMFHGISSAVDYMGQMRHIYVDPYMWSFAKSLYDEMGLGLKNGADLIMQLAEDYHKEMQISQGWRQDMVGEWYKPGARTFEEDLFTTIEMAHLALARLKSMGFALSKDGMVIDDLVGPGSDKSLNNIVPVARVMENRLASLPQVYVNGLHPRLSQLRDLFVGNKVGNATAALTAEDLSEMLLFTQSSESVCSAMVTDLTWATRACTAGIAGHADFPAGDKTAALSVCFDLVQKGTDLMADRVREKLLLHNNATFRNETMITALYAWEKSYGGNLVEQVPVSLEEKPFGKELYGNLTFKSISALARTAKGESPVTKVDALIKVSAPATPLPAARPMSKAVSAPMSLRPKNTLRVGPGASLGKTLKKSSKKEAEAEPMVLTSHSSPRFKVVDKEGQVQLQTPPASVPAAASPQKPTTDTAVVKNAGLWGMFGDAIQNLKSSIENAAFEAVQDCLDDPSKCNVPPQMPGVPQVPPGPAIPGSVPPPVPAPPPMAGVAAGPAVPAYVPPPGQVPVMNFAGAGQNMYAFAF